VNEINFLTLQLKREGDEIRQESDERKFEDLLIDVRYIFY
jgi:hypothetical protein